MKLRTCLAALGIALIATAQPASAKPFQSAPSGYFGVTLDGPATGLAGVLEDEIEQVRVAGARTVRFELDWATVQPYRTAAEVPPAEASRFADLGGAPTDFSGPDRIIGLANSEGITTIPVLTGRPAWATDRDRDRFVALLAGRYGKQGTFWSDKRATPVREWQYRNTVPTTGAAEYVAQLRATRRGLRATDASARVLTGGLTGSRTQIVATLRKLYRARGKGSFDAVGLDLQVAGSGAFVRTLRAVRRQLRSRRNPVPITITGLTTRSASGLRSTMRASARYRSRLGLAGMIGPTWLAPDGGDDPRALNSIRGDRIERGPLLFVFRDAVDSLMAGGA